MFFESLRTERGCISYVIGCGETGRAIIVDPELSLRDRYLALTAQHGLRIHYLLDTHTHADHFSAVHLLAKQLDVPSVMHRLSPAPFVDLRVEDGQTIRVGDLRLEILHTPGHTIDSICVTLPGHVLSGDTLLLSGTGRTDLPTGDPEQLYDSLFNHLLELDGSLMVQPAHNYKSLSPTSLDEQRATNPRLQTSDREAFVEQMRTLSLGMPDHLSEALRTNQTGGKTVDQIISEASHRVPFMSLRELRRRLETGDSDISILDVREADAYADGHVPGAIHISRGQLELRVDSVFPDPSVRILVYCEFGKISTIAAATLQEMGFLGAMALDGGIRSWREAGGPIESTNSA